MKSHMFSRVKVVISPRKRKGERLYITAKGGLALSASKDIYSSPYDRETNLRIYRVNDAGKPIQLLQSTNKKDHRGRVVPVTTQFLSYVVKNGFNAGHEIFWDNVEKRVIVKRSIINYY